MPAITVDDLTVLPRIAAPDPAHRASALGEVGDHGPERLRGRGLPGPARLRRRRPRATSTRSSTWTRWARWSTRRASRRARRGTRTAASRPSPTSWTARSSTTTRNGGGGTITNGDTQWMTAGAGILHIEKPPETLVISGGLFHGIQLWVNLPAAQKWSPAALPGHPGARGARCSRRAMAGRSSGSSPARSPGIAGPGSTYTPMTLVHATLSPERDRSSCRGAPTTTRSSTSSPASAPSAPSASRSRPGSSRSSAPGDVLTGRGFATPGEPRAEPRRPHPGRPADPRAGGLGRSVRHEHPRPR